MDRSGLLAPNTWALVKVAIETGCRRGELLNAEVEQINGDRLHLWETKTDSPRTVYMEPETIAMLVELLTSTDVQKRRPSQMTLRRPAGEAARANMGLAGDEDFVFHSCRHTRATRLLEAGVDLPIIQAMLGHKHIETTMRYAHVKASNIESTMEKMGEYTRLANLKAQKASSELPPPQLTRRGI